MITGKIHSIESMGLADGPGVRTIVFFQGCKLRCAYCHNPDTWNINSGNEITTDELMKKLLRYKPYFNSSGGGITFSGGEPLLQPEFLLEMLKLCRENEIHTAIDTAGYGFANYSEILKYTDLILLDIKHIDDLGYKNLTGCDKSGFNEFVEAVNYSNVKVWIRHVIVSGITDSKEHILKLNEIIKTIKNIEKVELLPYHTMGISKYENLNIKYPLVDLHPTDENKIKELEAYLIVPK